MQIKYIKSKNRYIHTKIPAKGTKKILNSLQKYESSSMHGQIEIVWSKAKNFNIYDISKNKFIDFTSTIFVSNIGHSNRRLKKYVQKSIRENLIHSYNYLHKTRENYLKKLVKFAGKNFQKAFLMSSGTESTEAALKLMRLYGQKKKKKKLGIICFEGNWHGRTMGAQLMSGNNDQKKWIGITDKNMHHLPFPYPWKVNENNSAKFLIRSLNSLKKRINLKKDVCGVMIETFQGWGAVYYPKKYIKLLSKICKKNDILITFDEIQSGFGRTGYRFGYEYYGIIPDLICCAKGMGGGIPISGVIGKKSILDLPGVGNMSSTNSANPISCSAGLAVIDEINSKKLVLQSRKLGKILNNHLNSISKNCKVKFTVHGRGLIAGIVFNSKISNIKVKLRRVVINCMKEGLLIVYTGRESIKIGPPLTISKNALIEGLQVLENNLYNVFGKCQ